MPWSFEAANLRYLKHRVTLARIAYTRAEYDLQQWEGVLATAQGNMQLPPLLVSEATGLPPVKTGDT